MRKKKKHVEHTSMLCLSCVAQQSNVMSIEPNWEARTLEHGTSLGATNGYDEIFVHCSFLLSLLGYFLCHLLQECHNSPDGIHLVPHLHGTNSRQRQIGKGKKQKCRPSNHDCAVSTYHCFVCSDKKPEPEVAQKTEQRVAQRGPQH